MKTLFFIGAILFVMGSAVVCGQSPQTGEGEKSFKPILEASLPEGFPEPTPVSEIRIKQYPKYRYAKTEMTAGENRAFWTLFTHIQKNDIAMTAPVEVTYGDGGNPLERKTMAFLYRSTRQGQLGKEEAVEIVDVPPGLVVSLGVRGDITQAQVAGAKARLDNWLKEHAREYEVCGALRVMGYNSPFVPVDRRFLEVEIPVRRIAPMQ